MAPSSLGQASRLQTSSSILHQARPLFFFSCDQLGHSTGLRLQVPLGKCSPNKLERRTGPACLQVPWAKRPCYKIGYKMNSVRFPGPGAPVTHLISGRALLGSKFPGAGVPVTNFVVNSFTRPAPFFFLSFDQLGHRRGLRLQVPSGKCSPNQFEHRTGPAWLQVPSAKHPGHKFGRKMNSAWFPGRGVPVTHLVSGRHQLGSKFPGPGVPVTNLAIRWGQLGSKIHGAWHPDYKLGHKAGPTWLPVPWAKHLGDKLNCRKPRWAPSFLGHASRLQIWPQHRPSLAPSFLGQASRSQSWKQDCSSLA